MVVAVNDLGGNMQILGETEVAIDSRTILGMYGGRFLFGMDVHRDAYRLQMVGHASRPA